MQDLAKNHSNLVVFQTVMIFNLSAKGSISMTDGHTRNRVSGTGVPMHYLYEKMLVKSCQNKLSALFNKSTAPNFFSYSLNGIDSDANLIKTASFLDSLEGVTIVGVQKDKLCSLSPIFKITKNKKGLFELDIIDGSVHETYVVLGEHINSASMEFNKYWYGIRTSTDVC